MVHKSISLVKIWDVSHKILTLKGTNNWSKIMAARFIAYAKSRIESTRRDRADNHAVMQKSIACV